MSDYDLLLSTEKACFFFESVKAIALFFSLSSCLLGFVCVCVSFAINVKLIFKLEHEIVFLP